MRGFLMFLVLIGILWAADEVLFDGQYENIISREANRESQLFRIQFHRFIQKLP
jgi:hypothetical protein